MKNNSNPNVPFTPNEHLTIHEKPLLGGYLKSIDASVNSAYPVVSRPFMQPPIEQQPMQPVQTIQQRNAEEVDYLAQLRQQQAAANNVALAYASTAGSAMPQDAAYQLDMTNPGPEKNPNYDFDTLAFSPEEVGSARAAVERSFSTEAAVNQANSYV